MLGVLSSNYLINVAFISFVGAQLLKMLFVYIIDGKWVAERMFGAGGMPSSHSALVCSLALGTVRKLGFASPIFALTLVLAGIVMYDAMGVRRAAGEQAKVLNRLVFDFKFLDFSKVFLDRPEDADDEDIKDAEAMPEGGDSFYDQKRLKEYIGHTPFEVLGGALVGILVAIILPVK